MMLYNYNPLLIPTAHTPRAGHDIDRCSCDASLFQLPADIMKAPRVLMPRWRH